LGGLNAQTDGRDDNFGAYRNISGAGAGRDAWPRGLGSSFFPRESNRSALSDA
jgi:hypothetical protein